MSRILFLLAGAVAAAALPLTTRAQPAGIATEEVVVTGLMTSPLTAPSQAGSRLGLSALDTPASVTVLAGDTIRLRGDPNVNAAVTRAVGITTNASVGGGGNSVAVRGFNGASIAYLYDGIRNEAGLGNIGWPYDPWTVDRIEVLNGPASVLYGAGGIGGAINIVPRRPSGDPATMVRIAAASFNTWRTALDSTGPVTDRLLYRLDVSRQSSDGYINNGKSESTAISAATTFVASPALQVTLSEDYALIKPMNYNGLPMVNGTALRALRRQNYQTGDADVYFNENTERLNIAWTPNGAVSLRNVTSAVLGDRDWRQGPTQLFFQPAGNTVLRGSYGDYKQTQTQFNNQTELRLQQPIGGHENTLSAGADVEHLNFKRLVTTWPSATSAVGLTAPDPGTYPATGAVLGPAQDMRMWRYALFAEDRLVLAPGLSLVGGLRFDDAAVDRRDLTNGTVTSRRYQPLNWRIGAVYEAAPNTSVYAQYSNAVDFVSNLCCISAAQMAFSPSRGTQFEIGVKQSTWNGQLEWTLAGYQIIKNDLLVADPNNIANLLQVGAQSSLGGEASVVADLGDGVRIEANGTLLNPKYDSFREPVAGALVSRNGNHPTNVPSQSANLWVSYQFLPEWLAQAGLRYVGKRFINSANTLRLPAYSVVDAGLHWSVTDTIAIDAKANNLLDAFYPYNFTSDGHDGGNWNVAPPRNFEISLTARL